VSLYLLIGYPSEQVFVQNLLSSMLVSPSVTRLFVGELCAANSCLILVIVIKMMRCFKGRISLKKIVKKNIAR
jgi:hypothetical protein